MAIIDVINAQLVDTKNALTVARDHVSNYIAGLAAFATQNISFAVFQLQAFGSEAIDSVIANLNVAAGTLNSLGATSLTTASNIMVNSFFAINQAAIDIATITQGLIDQANLLVSEVIGDQIESVKNFMATALDVVISEIGIKLNFVQVAMQNTIDVVLEVIDGLAAKTLALIQPAIDAIPDAIKDLLGTIPQTFIDLLSDLFLEDIPEGA